MTLALLVPPAGAATKTEVRLLLSADTVRAGETVTAGVLQLQPFLVAIASLWLFGEWLNGWQWLGGTILIPFAVWAWTNRRQRKKRPK